TAIRPGISAILLHRLPDLCPGRAPETAHRPRAFLRRRANSRRGQERHSAPAKRPPRPPAKPGEVARADTRPPAPVPPAPGAQTAAQPPAPATASMPASGPPPLRLRYTILTLAADNTPTEVPNDTVFHAGDRIRFA